MADPTNEKVQAYKAATELLGRKDDAVLRYVALELRRCIEAVVYEKLVAYGDLIPADAARTWQPPQAFKALLAVEPGADKDAVIAIGPQRSSTPLLRGRSRSWASIFAPKRGGFKRHGRSSALSSTPIGHSRGPAERGTGANSSKKRWLSLTRSSPAASP